MRKKVLWITETAVMLALLVTLQALTKPMGQLVTGSCVNAVLAISVLLVGMSSGITIALISPVWLLHNTPPYRSRTHRGRIFYIYAEILSLPEIVTWQALCAGARTNRLLAYARSHSASSGCSG